MLYTLPQIANESNAIETYKAMSTVQKWWCSGSGIVMSKCIEGVKMCTINWSVFYQKIFELKCVFLEKDVYEVEKKMSKMLESLNILES